MPETKRGYVLDLRLAWRSGSAILHREDGAEAVPQVVEPSTVDATGGGFTSESARKGVETKRANGTIGMSDQTRAKISASNKGKPKSEEHKQALRCAWKRTPEQIEAQRHKASATSKGRINIKTYVFS